MAQTGRPATRQPSSVGRAVTLLDLLTEAGGGRGTNASARRTDSDASSVSRLPATLVPRVGAAVP